MQRGRQMMECVTNPLCAPIPQNGVPEGDQGGRRVSRLLRHRILFQKDSSSWGCHWRRISPSHPSLGTLLQSCASGEFFRDFVMCWLMSFSRLLASTETLLWFISFCPLPIVFTNLYFCKDINPLFLCYVGYKYLIPAFCVFMNFVEDLSELLFIIKSIHLLHIMT